MVKYNNGWQWSEAAMPPGDDPSTPYEYTAEQPASLSVVEALAALEGVEPTELNFTLYDHIQPQALDTLTRKDPVAVTFTVDQYTVHIDDSGTVRITS